MLAPGLKKVVAFPFVAVALLAVSLIISHKVLGQEKPIEGAGELAAAGSGGIDGAPELPDTDKGKKEKDKELTMTASYYGQEFAGSPTASGEPFDPGAHTAAHKSLPLGTELLVKRGGESVRVTVNDRGPYVAGRDLDLSAGAAQEIGLIGPGEDRVEVVRL